jgi:hypothetical protein
MRGSPLLAVILLLSCGDIICQAAGDGEKPPSAPKLQIVNATKFKVTLLVKASKPESEWTELDVNPLCVGQLAMPRYETGDIVIWQWISAGRINEWRADNVELMKFANAHVPQLVQIPFKLTGILYCLEKKWFEERGKYEKEKPLIVTAMQAGDNLALVIPDVADYDPPRPPKPPPTSGDPLKKRDSE